MSSWDYLNNNVGDEVARLQKQIATNRLEHEIRRVFALKPADKPGITTINLADYEIGIAYNGEA